MNERGILYRLWWFDEFPVSNIAEKDDNDDK